MKKQLIYWYRKYTPKKIQEILINKEPFWFKLYRHKQMAKTFNAYEEGNREHYEIITLIEKTSIKERFYVDLGASNGISSSSTFLFAKNQNWGGLSVEFDEEKFSIMKNIYKDFNKAYLSKTKITPNNIKSILEENQVPKNFTFLNLDIDSYDLFIIEEILKNKFKPYIISMEINEKIPPPIYFTVLYDENHFWKGDHFFGCSIVAADSVLKEYGYKLHKLQYNNAIFLSEDYPGEVEGLTPSLAYDLGYRNKDDRKKRFNYNKDVDVLLKMNPQECIDFINNFFSEYKDMYDLSINE